MTCVAEIIMCVKESYQWRTAISLMWQCGENINHEKKTVSANGQ